MRIPLRASETQRRILDSFALDLHTALPGVVRSYDAASQTADIELGIRRVLPAVDEEGEADTTEALPILPAVPIAWPRAGGFFLHWPMAAGDTVLVIFSEADTNAWRASGGVVDPGIATRHGLSGAVAVPGYHARSGANGDASGAYGRVGREGGPFVEFRAAEIMAGGTKTLAEAALIEAHLKAIEADLDAIAIAAGTTSTYIHDTLEAIIGSYHTSILKGD